MTVRILIGDCRERLKELPDASVDSVVCDPPYGLGFMGKEWDKFGGRCMSEETRAKQLNNDEWGTGKRNVPLFAAAGKPAKPAAGEMAAFQSWCETWAAEVLRVLKPGGHMVAFSGTRTYHRMVCAIEDAGFEIRDQLAWVFASGFPKSHNLDKALGDENRCLCGAETLPERDLRLVRDGDVSKAVAACETGGQVLLPSLSEQSSSDTVLRAEPAQKPSDGTQPGLEGWGLPQASSRELPRCEISEGAGVGAADGAQGRLHNAASASDGADVRLPADALGSSEPQGSQPGEQSSVEPGAVADERGSQARGSWPVCGGCRKPIVPTGYGSALKPAYEPICLARKPLQGTILGNFLTHGTGALNIDGCRIEGGDVAPTSTSHKTTNEGWDRPWRHDDEGKARILAAKQEGNRKAVEMGRWPANLCHDGSDEVVAGFPESDGAVSNGRKGVQAIYQDGIGSAEQLPSYGDSGSAARFFYCAKATTEERGQGNNHPTVKPAALMRWLCRLVTPKGGTILDPFMGSGSTGLAADAEQFNFIGCELSGEYAEIARRRICDQAGMFADVEVIHTGPETRAA